ncbi:MAG: SUMF1/EgtB/PvdO family nonheme iron enzyme [Ardenticatenaceae bacterium]|nr:SUMF1/EgtB/PvdO family nonheme iron enzyme [Ardenticatenaceae bacterium]
MEAKERALIHLAHWMQTTGKTDVAREAATTQLADYFEEYEGAQPLEKTVWARNFLDVAHQRSGLFVEYDTGSCLSHKNFLEYLAATALVDKSDEDMRQTVLVHAADPSWEEVIRLAFAHEKLPRSRYKLLLDGLLAAGHVTLAGHCTVDAGARLSLPLRREVQMRLYDQMVDSTLPPKQRFLAAEALDESGWLPPDVHEWVRCPGCAQGRRDLYVAKYPVTNAQFALFMEAGGYENEAYWQDGKNKGDGWRWRIKEYPDYRGQEAVTEPRYWHDARFGRERHGCPVVGVSWYEAAAYAAWLSDLLRRGRDVEGSLSEAEMALVADLLASGAQLVRLPQDEEWVRVAGNAHDKRFLG